MRNLLLLLLFMAQFSHASYRIFWIDIWNPGAHTRAEADTMLNAAVMAKANTVFVGVRPEGHAYFLNRIEPLPQPGWTYETGYDAISYIVERGHALGLEVHAWMDMAPLWNPLRGYTPADPTHKWHQHGIHVTGSNLWITSTELSDYKGGGNGGMVDFGHPEAARHAANVIVDVLRHYNLDGIHLDYIRYPYAVDITSDGKWNPEFYGWNPTSIERFNRLNGRSGRPAQSDPAWQAWRRNQVTNVVRQVYLRAKEIRPLTKVSASVTVWGTPPTGENFETSEPYQVGFQDWHSWLQEGIVDFLTPMLYRKEHNAAERANFDGWLTWFSGHKHGRQVVPGVGLYVNSAANSFLQIDRVLNHSGQFGGVSMFSYRSTNNEQMPNATFYDLLGSRWGSAPAPPAMPWVTNLSTGHALGQVTILNATDISVDGLTAEIRNSSTHAIAKTTTTDGLGFFGAAGLAPDSYYVALKQNNTELLRSASKAVYAGAATRFDLTFDPAQAAAACTYAVSPNSVWAAAAGGLANLTVTASAPTCQWTAGAGLPWGVTLLGSANHTGSTVLQYSFAPNTGAMRAGSVEIAGILIPMSQYGAPPPPTCTYQITPKPVTIAAAGGIVNVTVTASSPLCQWTAGTGFSWGLSLIGSSNRTGTSVLQYSFAPNTGATRGGYVRMAGTSISFMQWDR